MSKYCDCCGKRFREFSTGKKEKGIRVYTTKGVKTICCMCNLFYQKNDKLPK